MADRSFNAITIDGDTSTNDTLVLVATGRAGNPEIIGEGTAEFAHLAETVTDVAQALAQAIVRDGEGATKFITIAVEQGATREECVRVAKAHRALAAGEDRVLRLRPEPRAASSPRSATPASTTSTRRRSTLHLGDVLVAEKGGRAATYTEEQGKRVMKAAEITVRVGLGPRHRDARPSGPATFPTTT